MIYLGKKWEEKLIQKLVSVGVLLGLVMAPAFGAVKTATPSHITKTDQGGYDVTYTYKDKAKTNWYVTGRAELSLLNFKNKYSSTEPDMGSGSDSYSFKPVFGGSLAAGRKLDYFWRAELEAGYLGYFNDEDAEAKFSISLPYIMASGYYDFTNGLYVGAGLGASLAQYKLSGDIFEGYSKDKTAFSPMVGLMFGWTHQLDDNIVLDLRYRLSAMTGAELKMNYQREVMPDGQDWYSFKSKTDMILDNSVSLGLRYEF